MKVLLPTLALALFLSSCASFSGTPGPGRDAPLVVRSAYQLLGQRPDAKVKVRGRIFTLDCIGTVSAAYWGAGTDLQRDFFRYQGNGVTRLWRSLEDHDALIFENRPQPGNLVFWDNTWDANGDGVFGNDGHTHAGLVVEVHSDGEILYLHESVTRGVVIDKMNLLRPDEALGSDGEVVNSPMYLGSSPRKKDNPPRYLAGSLWAAFGRLPPTF